MSIKLYVGNLPHSMTEEELRTLFSEAGNVASAKIITDRQTGQPRGFGFVEMESKVEGQKAISMLNGRTVDGRPLTGQRSPAAAKKRLRRRRRPGWLWRRRWWRRRWWRWPGRLRWRRWLPLKPEPTEPAA